MGSGKGVDNVVKVNIKTKNKKNDVLIKQFMLSDIFSYDERLAE